MGEDDSGRWIWTHEQEFVLRHPHAREHRAPGGERPGPSLPLHLRPQGWSAARRPLERIERGGEVVRIERDNPEVVQVPIARDEEVRGQILAQLLKPQLHVAGESPPALAWERAHRDLPACRASERSLGPVKLPGRLLQVFHEAHAHVLRAPAVRPRDRELPVVA